MVIRKLTARPITREILDLLCQLADTSKLDIKIAQVIAFVQEQMGHFTLVGYEAKTPIAIGSIIITNRFIHNSGRIGHIEDVAVRKDLHGKGYGKQLIKRLVKIAKDSGCYKVILDCSDNNIPFYEKCGFKRSQNQLRMDL